MSDPQRPAPGKYIDRELGAAGREFHRLLAQEGRLCTTRCPACGRTAFPPRLRCPACSGPQEWVELPRRGRLYAFTTQETALRFRAPEVLALAEVGEVVVPGVARGDYERLAIGEEVEIGLLEEPETGLTLLEFAPVR